MSMKSSDELSGLLRAAFSGLMLLPLAMTPSYAQQNSGAGAVTLTAVLAQSLTVSVAADDARGIGRQAFDGSALHPSLNVATRWVRGQSNLKFELFASGNPILGQRRWDVVPIEIPSPQEPSAANGSGTFSFLKTPDKTRSPGFNFSTGDLQILPGSEPGTLTLRADAL